MQHRRLQVLFAIISLFAFGVIIWYFLFSKTSEAPTLTGTANPLSVRDLPARLGFIFKSNPPETTTETEITDPAKEAFLLVWEKPSAGNAFVTRAILKEVTATTTVGTSTILTTKSVRATTTILMFVDRTTGYVYGHNVESGTTYQISNSTIPGVHDAYIWSGGDRIVVRYLSADRKTIISTLGTVPNVQEGHDAQPLANITTLPNNISSIAVSPSGNTVSYIVPNDAGASIYTITSKGTVHVADSPFAEWTLSYGGEQLYATTKASAYVQGTTVSLPSFARIIGEKTGLTSTPSSGGLVLHSMWAKTGLSTFVTKGSSLVQFSIQTLSSKCAPSGTQYFICGVPKALPAGDEGLPDDWYQGRASFDDTLMLLDSKTGNAFTAFAFDQKYAPFDVTSVGASAKGDLLSFIRKQDGYLFLLNTNLLDGE
jgi:hypothetical protein